ncbi:unnamed protein product [Rhizoctonia solani]|uniref:Uncharacterized protein n=1 Tax=Rhizoctonia solani TaxID=456999 RepID=A0A8H3DT73_9AGAM|nr:unnamed protein product [Rhizoctonia solani]
MGTNFDSDQVSDREVVPRTPTLAGSTSSLDDSLLQSPYSTRFLSASASSPTKGSSHSGSRAWWGERISTDSSNYKASIDLRPLESPSGDLTSREVSGPLRSRSQSDETASATSAPTPNCGPSVSAEGSPSPDAEELDAGRDEPESSCYPPFQRVANASAEPSQLSISSLLASETNVDEAPHSSLVPHLSVAHQSVDSEPSYLSITLPPLLNISCANSSMLAQCDQSSLAPPCVSMAQTQWGREALREAGIAHGSPRALAPSPPIENIPNRSQNESFFHRLMRKTFSISSFTGSTKNSNPLSARSAISTGNQKSQYSWPTRHNTMPSRQAKASSSSPAPSPSKRSRWELIQRFVAKPSTAAKAAGATVTRRTLTRPTAGDNDNARRHTVMSGHSSSVSFFGDPLVLVDPFARSGGLGATISRAGVNSSELPWDQPSRASDLDAHILSFPLRRTEDQSQDGDSHEAEADSPSLRPPNMLLNMFNTDSGSQAYPPILPTGVGSRHGGHYMQSMSGDPAIKQIGRRHSAPLMDVAPL